MLNICVDYIPNKFWIAVAFKYKGEYSIMLELSVYLNSVP